MKPRVTRMECVRPDWIRVVNAARRTWGKKPIDHEPSEEFKRTILLAEHSPIRLLEYDFTLENVRQWVTVHIARHHVGCEKFIHTQRQDINQEVENLTKQIVEIFEEEGLLRDGWRARDYMFQGECNDMDMTCNAQAFINISRKRLCLCASNETRQAWSIVIDALREVDPILAEKCVPDCVYRGFCPESTKRCCGYVNSPLYQARLEQYRKH